jgi:sulfatase maturation enzyme AslB (radical SAM superfamily)
MYSNGLQNGLITNGSLLTDQSIDIVAKVCRWVGFSMDAATSKTFNK